MRDSRSDPWALRRHEWDWIDKSILLVVLACWGYIIYHVVRWIVR